MSSFVRSTFRFAFDNAVVLVERKRPSSFQQQHVVYVVKQKQNQKIKNKFKHKNNQTETKTKQTK